MAIKGGGGHQEWRSRKKRGLERERERVRTFQLYLSLRTHLCTT